VSKDIIIVGAGGHAVSVTNVALSCGINVVAYVDNNKAGSKVLDIPVITKQQCIDTYKTANFAIAIGDNSVRERVYNDYKLELPNCEFPPLIHQTAVIGINSKVGDGTVIMPQTNIGPNSKVGVFCILNTSSSIDHDCDMQSFSSIAPRVVTGGNVNIGVRSALSIGATVKHGIVIGDDVVIGANSYVNKPFDSNLVAYGTPCKFVRERTKEDAYLS
jgi:sugar O-acyltransferase (sialic acid O-acetyltransferase NeuD family)